MTSRTGAVRRHPTRTLQTRRASSPRFACRLIVMAKVPVMGRVKTRLACEVGAATATRFYRSTLSHVVGRLARDPRFETSLAVAPDVGRASPALPRGVRRIGQGGGDLGQRMQRLLDQASPGPAIIVGTDIPAIQPGMIAAAFRALGRNDAVFGPAEDGGFWLVGVPCRRSAKRLFMNVRWSTAATLADAIRNLPTGRIGIAASLSDVDTARDFNAQRRFIGRRVISVS
jgi:uncharacterized protein